MKKIIIPLLATVIFLHSCFLMKKQAGMPVTLQEPDQEWVETTLSMMTIDQKIGQLIMPYVGKAVYDENSPEFRKMKTMVQRYNAGGFIFSGGEAATRALQFNRLQELSKIPLLIAADMETGAGWVLESGTLFPAPMALGATGDSKLAYAVGRITAREARSVGVHLIFAPVLDINTNPDNPIIGYRSFSDDATTVAEMGSAFIRGIQDNGALAVAKHFPGHGRVSVDSHLDMPENTAGLRELELQELIPFRQAVKTDIAGIMTAHIAFPNTKSGPNLPATLSPYFLKEILRNKMHFEGLILTDALGMGGLRKNYFEGKAAVQAIIAGADILLMPRNVGAVFFSIRRAVQGKRISMARIDESVRRILACKAKVGLNKSKLVSSDWMQNNLGRQKNEQLAEDIQQKAVTILRNTGLPLLAERVESILLIRYVGKKYRKKPQWKKNDLWEQYFPGIIRTVADERLSEAELQAIMQQADSVEVIVNSLHLGLRDNGADSLFNARQERLLKYSLSSRAKKINIIQGPPYALRRFSQMKNIILTYSDNLLAQNAALKALTGAVATAGKLPVSVPPIAGRGEGDVVQQRSMEPVQVNAPQLVPHAQYLDSLRLYLQRSIADSAFPGCAIAVGYDGYLIMKEAFGRYVYDDKSKRVTTNSMFDLASLTKVVATATAAMKLYEQGRLDLDWKVVQIVPEFAGPGKENVTIRHLLTHSSGLPAWRRFYLEMTGKERIIAEICKTELEQPPGTKYVYSDLGMILMMHIIESLTQKPFDFFVQENIFIPLEMSNTMYNPPPQRLADIIPTEISEFHKGLVRGFVHDENTWAMGGVSGHAGLFSTVEDLSRFCQMLLNGGFYVNKRLLRPETVALFTSRQHLPQGSDRALGWDTRSAEGSSSGHLMSARAFGHTGFTGTSLWLDPENRLFVLLLTNRVYPSRENKKIYRVRPRVHDYIMKAILD